MIETRSKKAMRNVIVGIVLMMCTYVMSFLYRRVFLLVFNEEYLGVSSLVTNLIQILSLAELGFGSAIMYALFKPLAEHNETQVSVILKYFRKVYLFVAFVVLLIGLSLLPFLPVLLKTEVVVEPSIYIIYLFYLSSSVLSYFNSYKITLLAADQKEYISKILTFMFNIVSQILTIVFLYVFKNFYVVLIMINIVVVAQNLVLTIIVNKKYPYINKVKEVIDKADKTRIKKYTLAMLTHRIGSVVLNSTDSVIISAFLGAVILGRYSNYLLIVTGLTSILTVVFSSITSTVGEFIALKPVEEQYSLYKMVNLLCSWASAFSAIGLYFVSKSFITIWLGEQYVLDNLTVVMISLSFYVESMSRSNGIFNQTLGLFKKSAPLSLAYAIINIIVSLLLVKPLGLAGVFLGTIISRLIVFPLDAWIVNHYGFSQYKWEYLINLTKQICVGVIAMGTVWAFSFVPFNNAYGEFFARLGCCILVPNVVYLIFFARTKEFSDLLEHLKVKRLLNKLFGRKFQ